MRVFPLVGITAPRLPFEKSYTFLIVPSLSWVGLPHRDDSHVLATGRVNDDHQDPNAFIPMVTKRCSRSALWSSMVSASGSFRTPSPADSDTPCFLMFAASFFGSNSTATEGVYARYAYSSNRYAEA